jgi:transforming growth factor-beta-induced protein
MGHLRTALIAAASTAILLTGCSDDSSDSTSTEHTTTTAKPPASARGTVADYPRSDPQLSTTAALLATTPLAKRLDGAGSFTFFAPTNAAWAALPPEELKSLQGSPDRLTEVLSRHVVTQELAAADLVRLNGKDITTLAGKVPVAIDGRTLKVDGATVSRTDILASNGVIHEVDTVATTPGG